MSSHDERFTAARELGWQGVPAQDLITRGMQEAQGFKFPDERKSPSTLPSDMSRRSDSVASVAPAHQAAGGADGMSALLGITLATAIFFLAAYPFIYLAQIVDVMIARSLTSLDSWLFLGSIGGSPLTIWRWPSMIALAVIMAVLVLAPAWQLILISGLFATFAPDLFSLSSTSLRPNLFMTWIIAATLVYCVFREFILYRIYPKLSAWKSRHSINLVLFPFVLFQLYYWYFGGSLSDHFRVFTKRDAMGLFVAFVFSWLMYGITGILALAARWLGRRRAAERA